MKITFYGHATFEVKLGDSTLLFDPFFTDNPLHDNFDLNSLNPDWILASHGHGDHVADIEAISKSSNAKLISNYEIVNWFDEKGVKGHPINHGGKYSFDFGTVKYVNAIHTSSMPDGANGGDPGGFVIWNADQCFYFAGDTALTRDMELIPMTCPKLDVAILPIGDNFTMGYEDAAIAAEFIKCDIIIGCHYDTFGYIKIDKSKAIEAFRAKNKTLLLPNIGETIEI
ncbi:MAG: metal-dependent hydrolase [Saprospiraceae bacterium]|nr:metal-dependent hydrolase [Bacteroidia bacterium]NNE14964.1 metal-dependent hydrolase [Saprospiraceae bacterium]NNL92198.1 metal-dependent hydrolase [Saprospiraceae bacterium]